MANDENLFGGHLKVPRDVIFKEIRQVYQIFEMNPQEVLLNIILKRCPLPVRKLRTVHEGAERRKLLINELVKHNLIPEMRYRRIYRNPLVKEQYEKWLVGRG